MNRLRDTQDTGWVAKRSNPMRLWVKSLDRAAVLFLPRFAGVWVWVEVIVISAIAVGLGWLSEPGDPLHTRTDFPWPWFAPVLLALRYGVVPGIASAAILLGTWYALSPAGFAADPPKLYFLGGLLLVMVCGEYSGIWRTRLRRLAELNNYLEDRIERVTKRLYLMRLSHDRLEQDLLARPVTLRDSLYDLRRRLARQARVGPLPAAEELMQFLAQQCQLEVAALYAVEPDDASRYQRVAAVGEAPALDTNDALLMYMREHGELAHIQTAALDKSLPTHHLVVAPIKSARGAVLGVLVVTRMPFFALTHDALQTLAVLLTAYADSVGEASALLPAMEGLPGAPQEFIEEMAKLVRIQREFDIDSHIVVLAFGEHPLWWDAYQLVLRSRRAPDIVWRLESELQRSVFVNLLPVAGRAGVEGYLLRLENLLRENFGGGMEDLKIQTHVVPVSATDCFAALARAVQPAE